MQVVVDNRCCVVRHVGCWARVFPRLGCVTLPTIGSVRGSDSTSTCFLTSGGVRVAAEVFSPPKRGPKVVIILKIMMAYIRNCYKNHWKHWIPMLRFARAETTCSPAVDVVGMTSGVCAVVTGVSLGTLLMRRPAMTFLLALFTRLISLFGPALRRPRVLTGRSCSSFLAVCFSLWIGR